MVTIKNNIMTSGLIYIIMKMVNIINLFMLFVVASKCNDAKKYSIIIFYITTYYYITRGFNHENLYKNNKPTMYLL